ncbi:PQQ-dependent sugar dehydrogenase [Hoyosella sp. YIM 151337]|uniref:PQQ-dependent sugar dehydrogenase n=1 Tax=Hoyosella sp. YIM 151337 TaxID=2992742 RepID=UPI002235726C|nr:PQQ-dependent sugar dehydrogenase [Hoyosella sp. YIM 151337]MCW4354570.1 PQQ-dependent sugar dehydrogenase [Hoyosella sp. YIM 151337]
MSVARPGSARSAAPPASRRTGVRLARLTAAGLLSTVILTGCARFDDSLASPFEPEPTAGNFAELNPPEGRETPTRQEDEPPPEGPCVDPDPAVVATCLEPTSGLAVLPAGGAALVAERPTGRIFTVAPETEPQEFAQIDVDGSGDGGLLDIALSPTYFEDRLIFAYISTPTDNRIVRLAPGDTPRPVLTGIPKGASGNGASITFDAAGALLIRTGDAGDPAAATDPASLAGKILRLANPSPAALGQPEVAASGLTGGGGVCIDPVTGTLYTTDRTPGGDRLVRVAEDGTLEPLWVWSDSPGTAHCAALDNEVAVALVGGEAISFVEISGETRAVTGDPVFAVEGRYGQVYGAARGPEGEVWAGTVNRATGEPVDSDDRVFIIPPDGGGGISPD